MTDIFCIYVNDLKFFAKTFCNRTVNCVFGDDGIDAENGCGTHSLFAFFHTVTSIIFEKANADVDAKCEQA